MPDAFKVHCLTLNDVTPIEVPSHVKIIVRVRPLLFHEAEADSMSKLAVDTFGNTIIICNETTSKSFRCDYDSILGPSSTQLETYMHVSDCISMVVAGKNCSIFAYGQTGSGKTHTMYGPPSSSLKYEGNMANIGFEAGIIPRIINDLFSAVGIIKNENDQCSKDTLNSSFEKITVNVWCSFIQVYNEQAYDMLVDMNRRNPLTIHGDTVNGGAYCQGLTEYAVNSASECLELLKKGDQYRVVRDTQMNQTSSRSHSIFQVTVEQRMTNSAAGEEKLLQSKINLVDLAGSEKWGVTQEMTQDQILEITCINNSLHIFGRVVSALGKRGAIKNALSNCQHVPFRDSKLTRILQDSLDGNSHICIIATLSPSQTCVEESTSTLRFADRAKKVQTMVRVNSRHITDGQSVNQELKKEIHKLRNVIRQLSSEKQIESNQIQTELIQNNQFENQWKDSNCDLEPLKNKIPDSDIVQVSLKGQSLKPNMNSRKNSYLNLNKNVHLNLNPNLKSEYEITSESNNDLNQNSQKLCMLLFTAYEDLNNRLNQFFRFEIEEDRLKTEVASVTNRVQLATKPWLPYIKNLENRPEPLYSPYSGSNRVMLPSVHSNSESNFDDLPDFPVCRVRGKHADKNLKGAASLMSNYIYENDDARRENELHKELKRAKQRMKKNLELQAWLKAKDLKQLQNIQKEEEEKILQENSKKMDDVKFKKRAERQKQKLLKYYEEMQSKSVDTESSVTETSSM